MKIQIYRRKIIEIIFDAIAQYFAQIVDVKTHYGFEQIHPMKCNVKTAVSVKLSNFLTRSFCSSFLFNAIRSYGLSFMKHSLKMFSCLTWTSGFYYLMHQWYGL